MTDDNSTRWMPTAGGVINIVSGILGFIGAIVLAFIGAVVNQAILSGEVFWDFPQLQDLPAAFFYFTAFFVALLSLFALIGGILATQRKAWGMALAGSICAILQNGLLGIISTVFIALSKKEFTS